MSIPEEDRVLTSRDVAHRLGVSIKTAQGWIEANVPQSWKTPGGHRRAHERDVLAAQMRMAAPPDHDLAPVPVAFLTSESTWRHFRERLADVDARFEHVGDALTALSTVGRIQPAVVVIEISATDWDRGLVVNHLLSDSHLAHVAVIALCDERGRAHLATAASARLTVLARDAEAAAAEAVRAALVPFLDGASGGAEAGSAVPYPVARNEAKRLLALRRSGLVDSPYEDIFDDTARLAARVFSAPIALISLVTTDRQWFKAHHGLGVRETPRIWAFCNYTILGDSFVVEDAQQDSRFKDNVLVTGAPQIRFYAGAPLRDSDGYALGSLCVIDQVPRKASDTGMDALRLLADLISSRICLAQKLREQLQRHPSA
ncbi:GAF domain-containing protein [Burkholderia glumae]|uniref:GAF domain-containing protein n=1 Tax=Burkholderia glumae TaxID=337 RepID=A0AAQ0BRT0_BURGL|nr:GAF domain-containing protein [Burkholderia glumae]ACR32273.1 Putative GAF sensor protein [Burkholderia glumae BGR1]AJY63582.1 GAF domain protein [Burkholderia glumae LMG 2196 = ATCC 33617]KHJ61734.1 histidine kinase [Burkholderia glumae]MCM2494916.1 GAF domain-containing protein [Burkholderia glumae]MCM2545781.1 GAF domain-containing protein [Burkholderia glumae]